MSENRTRSSVFSSMPYAPGPYNEQLLLFIKLKEGLNKACTNISEFQIQLWNPKLIYLPVFCRNSAMHVKRIYVVVAVLELLWNHQASKTCTQGLCIEMIFFMKVISDN